MGRIVVTGIGIISAIGNNAAENQQSLAARKCGISRLEMFDSVFAGKLPVGEIKLSNSFIKEKLRIQEPGLTRTTLLMTLAIEEAIADSTLTSNQLAAPDTALIGGTTVAGMCLTDELYYDSKAETLPSEYVNAYDYATVMLYLQKRYAMTGIINTINTACSSSANAIMYGARLIKSGRAKRAIVGGADALAKYTLNGFNALHILSDDYCTPFDQNRKGLNLGEGAAFLVLEKEEDIGDKRIYASISGYSNSNDAYHPSSISANGEGPFLAMKGALKTANLQTSDIDFINTHGTGTENNDITESVAMLRLFDSTLAFTSTKANIGHTLGAAGAIEAVYSILNLVNQEIYPGLHFNNPIPETGLVPVLEYRKAVINHVMSNAFGFGGNCTSLIFSKA